MFITRVELRDIKNHADSAYTFQPGVISICGPNGSGKTTILEAIAWALFDHLEYKREDFVRRGAKKGQVTVGFVSDLDQREYLVTRETGGVFYVFDPVTRTRLVEQRSQVIPWLRQRLGVEPGTDLAVLFRTTIGVPQGTFTYDFTLPPASRKAIFDQILRVEEYREAADTLRVPQRINESKIVEVDRQISRFEGELAAWDETRQALDQARQHLSEIEIGLDKTILKRDQLGSTVSKLEEQRQQLDRQRSVVRESQLRLKGLEDRLNAGQQACQQAAAAANLVDRARPGWRSYLEIVKELERLEARREERDRQRTSLNNLEHQLIELVSVERQTRERLEEIDRLRVEAEPLSSLAERQRECEESLLKLREWRGESQSLRLSKDRLNDELAKLRTRYLQLTSLIEEAQRQSDAAASIELLEQQRIQLEEERQKLRIALETRILKQEELARLKADLAQRRAEEQRRRGELLLIRGLESEARCVPALEEELNRNVVQLATLRAEWVRDKEMIAGLESGGLCPLLAERCLNLGEGGPISLRLRSSIEERQTQIEDAEQGLTRIAESLQVAREAAIEYSRLSRESVDLDNLVSACDGLEGEVDRIQIEMDRLPANPDVQESVVASQLREVDTQLRAARESERLIHQSEVLTAERLNVQREGEARRIESDRIEARLAELGDIDRQILTEEQVLAGLGDPRSRLLALHQAIDREPELMVEAVRAQELATNLRQQIKPIRESLSLFELLDQQLSEASERRALHLPDYLLFIANEQLASTLEIRQQEFTQLEIEHQLLQQADQESLAVLTTLEDGYDPELHQRSQHDYESLREEVVRQHSSREHFAAQVLALVNRADSLAAVREQQNQLSLERVKLGKLGRKTELIREILVKSAPFITESYLFSISYEANQLYREITGRYQVTLRWTREYEILIEEDGFERPFSSLSGGEQMVAALAVRLALLRELSEINLAIFDEPTTNMDEERRRNLAMQLGRVRDFHQLFVISHDDSFEGLTDQQINLGGTT